MDKIRCNRCKEEKTLDNFYRDKRSATRYYKVCRACKKEIAVEYKSRFSKEELSKKAHENYKKYKEQHKEYWEQNKEKRRAIQQVYYTKHEEKISRKVRLQKQQVKEHLIKKLGDVCFICKQVYSWYVYDFHHLNPKEKEYNISYLYRQPQEILDQELAKCILVCANCHREIHYADNK